jgi:hypothetical protein
MSPLRISLYAAALMAGVAAVALAQPAPTYDPAQLPAMKGKVAQYTLTPRGDVDGLILDDGTEVHVPPSVSTELVFAVHPGDAVTIHGLKARAEPMIAAASITNDASGITVMANVGRRMGWRAPPIDDTSKVKEALHSPGGDMNGVLLDDGTVVRLPPREAEKLGATLGVGQPLFVRGSGIVSPLGKVIMARQVGPDQDHLTEIAAPRMRGGPWMRHGMFGMRGPDDGGPPPPPPKPAP